MKFLVHPNLAASYLRLLREFDQLGASPNEILDVESEYGLAAPMSEWLDCAGKEGPFHRPTIVVVEDGIRTNAVSEQSMRESRCSFVRFSKQWYEARYTEVVWRLMKVWPDVVSFAEAAKQAGRQCRIDVSWKCKVHVMNL